MKKTVFFAILFLFFGASFAEAQLVAPTSPSPSDGATAEQPVILKWSQAEFPAEIAGGYMLEIGGLILGTKLPWAETNSYTISQYLLAGTEYRWRVRACFGFDKPIQGEEESTCGPWSNNGVYWKFIPTLAKPRLLSPPNTTKQPVSLDPATKLLKLEWEKVVGADKYLVTLRKLSDGFTRVFEVRDPSKLIPDTFMWVNDSVFPLDLQNSFAWKVSAQQRNTIGPESDEWKFFLTLPKPTLLCPQNGTNVSYRVSEFVGQNEPCKNVTGFTWTPVLLSTRTPVLPETTYVFQVFDSANKKVLLPNNGIVSKPSASELGSLSSINKIGETYSWRVTACEAPNKNCGPPSTRSTFTLVFAPPLNPSLEMKVGPPARIELQWGKPLDPDPKGLTEIKYLWEIRNTQKQTIRKDSITTIANPVGETTEPTLAPGSYTLRAQACMKDGRECSDWSKDSPPLEVPDNIKPRIESFDVNPKALEGKWVNQANQKVTISWKVIDTGGSFLQGVQVKRANFDDTTCKDGKETTCAFTNVGSPVFAPTKTDSWECSNLTINNCPQDSPSDGTYWYSIIVFDNKNNNISAAEAGRQPIKVQVDKTRPSIDLLEIEKSPTTTDPTVEVKYTVSDGGSGLKEVRFWRRESGTTDWGTPYQTRSVSDGSATGTFTDRIASDRIYDYGLTVIDQAGNAMSMGGKEGPPSLLSIKVQVSAEEAAKEAAEARTLEEARAKAEAEKKAEEAREKPTGIFAVVDRAANVAFTALLIAASLFILIAAFQFLTGGGDPEQIASAKDKLMWAGVGIIVALVSKGAATILQKILLPSGEAPPKITCPPPPPGGIPNPLGAQGCLPGILDSIINVIFTLSLIVVPFVVLYAGFLFVTGGGNPEQITRARNTLIWTFVGFIVILVAKGLPFILKEILGI